VPWVGVLHLYAGPCLGYTPCGRGSPGSAASDGAVVDRPDSIARRVLRRATDRSRDLAQDAVRGLVVRSQGAAGALMANVVSQRFEQLADVAAARLLQLDDTASRLAVFVEQVSERVGRDAIVPVLLRRNLVLDGTMLSVMEPLLQGGGTMQLTPATRAKALATLVALLADIATLDGPPALHDADLHGLLAHPSASVLEPLAYMLAGHAPDEETDQFIMMSYLLFLQSFLLRTVAGMTATVVREQGQRLQLAAEAEQVSSGDPQKTGRRAWAGRLFGASQR